MKDAEKNTSPIGWVSATARRVRGIWRKGGMFFVFMLSFFAVFGGWFLTVGLLESKEENFLAREGSVILHSAESTLLTEEAEKADDEIAAGAEVIEAESIKEESRDIEFTEWQEEQVTEHAAGGETGQETDEIGFHGVTMSERTRFQVLSVWEKGGSELLHEPKPGQMNMEQAICAGQEWIRSMAGYGNIPKELSGCDFDKTSASLCALDVQAQLRDDEGALDEAMLSYWTVRFEKSNTIVSLKIHAASGEVWEADFSVEDENKLAETLDEGALLDRAFPFVQADAAPRELVLDLRTCTVYQSFPDGLVCAAVKRYDIHVNDKKPIKRIIFWIHTNEDAHESGYYH